VPGNKQGRRLGSRVLGPAGEKLVDIRYKPRVEQGHGSLTTYLSKLLETGNAILKRTSLVNS
jgi:hypothetical protein